MGWDGNSFPIPTSEPTHKHKDTEKEGRKEGKKERRKQGKKQGRDISFWEKFEMNFRPLGNASSAWAVLIMLPQRKGVLDDDGEDDDDDDDNNNRTARPRGIHTETVVEVAVNYR
jgi:hypothetical protein